MGGNDELIVLVNPVENNSLTIYMKLVTVIVLEHCLFYHEINTIKKNMSGIKDCENTFPS